MRKRPVTTAFWRGRLPHWEVDDGLYFVTMHLRGAIPRGAALELHQEARRLAKSFWRMQKCIFEGMEAWLDRSVDIRFLADPEIAGMVEEAILYCEKAGIWRVHEHVILSNHLHTLVEDMSGSLGESFEAFKRWTGRQARKIKRLPPGRFWQREWFDHWVRDSEEAEEIVEYIRNNPVKAGLVADYREWPYGSWRKK